MKQWNKYINPLKDYDLEEQDETELDACFEEQREDENLRREQEKKKARLRSRGPYRKAHSNR